MVRGPVGGRDFPRDLAELRAWFSTDEDCADYLDWLRWPDGFVCPGCGRGGAWRGVDGRYRCKSCKRHVTVTSRTVFDKTRTPLTVWFEVVWEMAVSKHGATAAHLHRVLPVNSYATVWAMMGRIRSLMGQTGGLLGGPGEMVEVDETFIGGGVAGARGRGAGRTCVVGAVEASRSSKGFGRARLDVVADVKAATLRAFITKSIAAGSTLRTDGLSSYPYVVDGYTHDQANVLRSGGQAHEALPGVHRLFALVKRWLDGIYQGGVQDEHLQEYLDEFVFRFNRRRSRARGMLFYRILERAVLAGPVTYRDLVRVHTPKAIHPSGPTGHAKPGTLAVEPVVRPWRKPVAAPQEYGNDPGASLPDQLTDPGVAQ